MQTKDYKTYFKGEDEQMQIYLFVALSDHIGKVVKFSVHDTKILQYS